MNYKYRSFAKEILNKINNEEGYSNILINQYIDKLESRKEKNLLNITVNGVIENKIFIDWIVNKLSKTKFKDINKNILEILRIAIYQMCFLDNISNKKIIYESVEEAKKEKNKYLAKYVNGVLRTFTRQKDILESQLESIEDEEYLSVKYSYPLKFIQRIEKEFDKESVEKILKSLNKKPDFTIRVNSNIISRDSLIEKLEERKITSHKTAFAKTGIKMTNPNLESIIDLYNQGLFSIQGESSMISVEILDPKTESNIIDMCSAPGGKGLFSAEILRNTGKVYCNDIYDKKIETIESQRRRLRLENVIANIEDGTKLNKEHINKFDFAIVDVPCTNSGIIRRKPEIKYRICFDNLEELTKKQYKLLENAGKYLKEKGTMIYSTCSIFEEENIDIVNKFLNNNDNFELVSIDKRYKNIDSNYYKGYINMYPHKNNLDGFFVAKIMKTRV